MSGSYTMEGGGGPRGDAGPGGPPRNSLFPIGETLSGKLDVKTNLIVFNKRYILSYWSGGLSIVVSHNVCFESTHRKL